MTQPELIRAVFALHGGKMDIPTLVDRCLEHGVFSTSRVRWTSMAAACRRALHATDPETDCPFAVRMPRRPGEHRGR